LFLAQIITFTPRPNCFKLSSTHHAVTGVV
jgi:hypothetical protein